MTTVHETPGRVAAGALTDRDAQALSALEAALEAALTRNARVVLLDGSHRDRRSALLLELTRRLEGRRSSLIVSGDLSYPQPTADDSLHRADGAASADGLPEAVARFLGRCRSEARKGLVVVDDAQKLSPHALRRLIRLLGEDASGASSAVLAAPRHPALLDALRGELASVDLVRLVDPETGQEASDNGLQSIEELFAHAGETWSPGSGGDFVADPPQAPDESVGGDSRKRTARLQEPRPPPRREVADRSARRGRVQAPPRRRFDPVERQPQRALKQPEARPVPGLGEPRRAPRGAWRRLTVRLALMVGTAMTLALTTFLTLDHFGDQSDTRRERATESVTVPESEFDLLEQTTPTEDDFEVLGEADVFTPPGGAHIVPDLRGALDLLSGHPTPGEMEAVVVFLRRHGPDAFAYDFLDDLEARHARTPTEAAQLLAARSRLRRTLCETWADDPLGEAPRRLGCPGARASQP